MTKEDKRIIDRGIKENWRIGDRTRLKHLLEKNFKLYRENEELTDENNKLLDVINNQDVKIADLEKENKILEGCLLAEQEHTQILEQQIEKMKCCANCVKYFEDCKMEDVTEEEYFRANAFCKHWELKE